MGRATEVRHPLDIDLVDFAEHLRECEVCRLKFARIMYEPAMRELKEILHQK